MNHKNFAHSQEDGFLVFSEVEHPATLSEGLPYKVLIADDEEEVHAVTKLIFRGFKFDESDIELLDAYSGKETLEVFRKHPDIAVIFLDVVMESNLAGLDVVHAIRHDLKNDRVRIVLRTGEPGQAPEERIIRDYDINDYRLKTDMTATRTKMTLITALRGYRDLMKIESHRTRLDRTQREIILAFANAVDAHFHETGTHVERISRMMKKFCLHLCLSDAQSELIAIASTMHDIGKVGIPDSILKKPGKLTEEEFEIIKQHPVIGRNILSGSDLEILKMASEIALYHHERYDGTGYPMQLKGDSIPLYARVMAILDVFDAITHRRIYKEAESEESAIAYLISQKGSQFDADLVDLFIRQFRDSHV